MRRSVFRSRSFLWTFAGLMACGSLVRSAAADDTPDYARLARQVRQAYNNADYKQALALSEKMHELRPDAVDPMYNIACLNCLLGDRDKAYEWLEKAVDAGYGDASHMAGDTDLRKLWGEPRFRALVRRAREGKTGRPAPPAEPNGRKTEPQQPPRSTLTEAQARQKVQDLTDQLVEAANDKEYEKALKLAEEARAVADIGLTNYNVACMHSLLGHKDDAFRHLERAVEQGMDGANMVSQIEGDADFEKIRVDPRYAKVLEKARKRPDTSKQVKAEWRITPPPGYDDAKTYPLLVVLHHYHGNMNSTTERWREAADAVGAIVLAPQGIWDMGDGNYEWGRNLDQIEDDVMAAIDACMDAHKIDSKRIAIAGFSQGAWAAWMIGLRNPDTFCGIIPVGGVVRPTSESLFEDPALKNLRVYVMLGEDESADVLESNRESTKNLEKVGSKVSMNVFDGVGHDFPKDAVREQIKALRFVLEP